MSAERRERMDAVIVGAGPAGLATSYHLRKRGISHVVLERGADVAHTWANLYDSLRLHTGRHLSALPGMPFPRGAPMFVSRADFVNYLRRYAERFSLPVRTRSRAMSAEREQDRWVTVVETGGKLESSALIVATGIVSNPRMPRLEGDKSFSGQILHSVLYRNPAPFTGLRVLVVGVGNSGAEIASELGRAGVDVTISVRSGANVVPLQILGAPIQYLAWLVRKLPRSVQTPIVAAVGVMGERRRGKSPLPKSSFGPLDAIPVIGFHLVDAIREGLVRLRPAIERIEGDAIRFIDGNAQPFDVIILATGFAPALEILRHPPEVDAKGFAMRSDRVTSADQEALFFAGHNYDANGGLLNIRIDSKLVAQRIELLLADRGARAHARR